MWAAKSAGSAGERHGAIGCRFTIFGGIQKEHRFPRGHGFDQRRVHAADFTGENVEAGVVHQLPVLRAINETSENDATIGERFQSIGIGRVVGAAAHHDERPIGLHAAVGLNHQLGIIFRLEAADVEHEFAGRQVEALQLLGIRGTSAP